MTLGKKDLGLFDLGLTMKKRKPSKVFIPQWSETLMQTGIWSWLLSIQITASYLFTGQGSGILSQQILTGLTWKYLTFLCGKWGMKIHRFRFI
jgi:hypothetical protein